MELIDFAFFLACKPFAKPSVVNISSTMMTSSVPMTTEIPSLQNPEDIPTVEDSFLTARLSNQSNKELLNAGVVTSLDDPARRH